MWGWITAIIKGIIGPITDAITSILNKRQDVTLGGWTAATTEDQAKYLAFVDYQTKIAELQTSQASALGWCFKLLYLLIGISSAIHYVAVMLDSTFLFNWHVARLPGVYETYEGWVVGSLFVHAAIAAPLSAATAWLKRR